MREAGYRDTSGNWLARPSRPLEQYGHHSSRFSSTGARRRDKAEAERSERERALGSGAGTGANILFVQESTLMEVCCSYSDVDDGYGCGDTNGDVLVAMIVKYLFFIGSLLA